MDRNGVSISISVAVAVSVFGDAADGDAATDVVDGGADGGAVICSVVILS